MYELVDHDLLGTVVSVRLKTKALRSPRRQADRILREMRRLSRVFNRFDPTSEITALRETGAIGGSELGTVLTLAADWHERTDGIFDPSPGRPELPWRTTESGIVVTGDTSSVDLNAMAKGWIVDRAGATTASRTSSLIIDAGGDVLHLGAGSVQVRIEDPAQPYDNATPVATIELSNEAIATSGPSRRGDHLIDPRHDGAPRSVAGASVIAATTATADVLATALAILDPDSGLALADNEQVAALVVAADGSVTTNQRWRDRSTPTVRSARST